MKIDAKIRWVIDDSSLGISSGTVEKVSVDADYVDGNDYEDIVEWIENELAEKYGTSMHISRNEGDGGDFTFVNPDEVKEDLNFSEFQDKTESW